MQSILKDGIKGKIEHEIIDLIQFKLDIKAESNSLEQND